MIAYKKNRHAFVGLCLALSAPAVTSAAMHDSHEHMHEHMMALSLVAYDAVTHTAHADGNWSDASTWGDDGVPGAGDRVLIPAGREVIVDTEVAAHLMTVRVDGTLSFQNDVNTQLRVDTLVSGPGSVLEIGTAEAPIANDVSARIVIDDYNNGFEQSDSTSLDYDPTKLGQGVITFGVLSVYGSPVTPYATLRKAEAGATWIKLDALPADWEVGDTLVIAGTAHDAEGDEVRVITDLKPAQKRVKLDRALEKDHLPPSHNKKGLALRLHVINTSRNAIIETEMSKRDTVIEDRFAGNDWYQRGHVMFMHTNDVNIHYGGFYGLGRTDKTSRMQLPNGVVTNPIARYAVHFHRAGSSLNLAEVHGSAVVESPGWGYVNHSSAVAMTHNVAYNVKGAAFVSEAGNEIGAFTHNVSIRTIGRSSGRNASMFSGADVMIDTHDKPVNIDHIVNFGSRGDGFWLQSRTMDVHDNVASGFSGTGYVIWPEKIDLVSYESTIPASYNYDPELAEDDHVRVTNNLKLFRDNLAYGGDVALEFGFNVGDRVGEQRNLIDSFVGFDVRQGLFTKYSKNFDFVDLVLIGNSQTAADSDSLNTSDFLTSSTGVQHKDNGPSFNYYNNHIEGFDRGITFNGRPEPGSVIGGYFNNRHNIIVNIRDDRAQNVVIRGDIVFGPDSEQNFVGVNAYNSVDDGDNDYNTNSVFEVDIPALGGPYRLWLSGNPSKPAGTIEDRAGFHNLSLEPISATSVQPGVVRGPHIENLSVAAGSEPVEINLHKHFMTPYNDGLNIEVRGNTAPDVVSTSINGRKLTLYVGDQSGLAIIQLGVEGQDAPIDAFAVNVTP